MNKYQRIIVIAAAVNIALMFLFPPFLDNPIRRGVPPSFEGFYFSFPPTASNASTMNC